ncbi:SGNH/GDSL hydrolase family protein [Zhihengliuella alba]|uniref:SGNH/GDSL hydrolase family protein n=1 Tax=Zhihengliuella alba TaxID=547018 RepID=A0ABP7DQW0_9MICC
MSDSEPSSTDQPNSTQPGGAGRLGTIDLSPDLLHGAQEIERTELGLVPHRLPSWVRSRGADGQLLMAESRPSGVRIAFDTDATVVELVLLPGRLAYRGGPARPDGVYDVEVDGELTSRFTAPQANQMWIDLQTGAQSMETGEPSTLRIDLADAGAGASAGAAGTAGATSPAGMRRVQIWLSHVETVELRALRADGEVRPVTADGPAWVHYGSSISQGSNAETAAGIWPVVAARRAGVDLANLGFGGSAMLDPFIARIMRDSQADLLSLKVGINIVGADAMRRRVLAPAVHGFIDTIRDGHPETPLLVISPIYCGIHEETPGPGAFDPAAFAEGRASFIATGDPADRAAGRLALADFREVLAEVVEERAAEDPNLHYLDGRELYGPQDAERWPLPDRLHPDSEAHRAMGERFAELALERFLPRR